MSPVRPIETIPVNAGSTRGFEQSMPPAVASARRAALALHSMAGDDQRWMLSRLPVGQRLVVQDLLDELRTLGLPAQADWLQKVCRSEVPAALTSLDRLRAWPAAEAYRLLSCEPDRLIADLLRLGSFTWQPALLAQLGDRQKNVEALLQAPANLPAGTGCRRSDALLRLLTTRASAFELPTTVPTQPRGAWQRLIGTGQMLFSMVRRAS